MHAWFDTLRRYIIVPLAKQKAGEWKRRISSKKSTKMAYTVVVGKI
jgi:hypothetical protein